VENAELLKSLDVAEQLTMSSDSTIQKLNAKCLALNKIIHGSVQLITF